VRADSAYYCRVPIRYPNAIWDHDEQRWISDAEVAETTFTAFTGRCNAQHITARPDPAARWRRGSQSLTSMLRLWRAGRSLASALLGVHAVEGDSCGPRRRAYPASRWPQRGKETQMTSVSLLGACATGAQIRAAQSIGVSR
jgi:hypothetical protein